jgi:hypothetical protein
MVAEIGPGIVRDSVVFSLAGASNENMKGMMSPGSRQSRTNRMSSSRMQGYSSDNDSSLNLAIAVIDQPVKYRSVYLPVIRDSLTRAMEVFDFAEPSMVVGVRESSNTPDQGLFFLNNTFVMEQSDAIARRIMREETDVRAQIKLAFLLAYGRQATSTELKAAERFLREFQVTSSRFRRGSGIQKLSALCHSILASAEFRFVN